MIYAIPVYAMAKLHSGADRVALFFCVAAVFAAAVGALSMAVTVGRGPLSSSSSYKHRFEKRTDQPGPHLC